METGICEKCGEEKKNVIAGMCLVCRAITDVMARTAHSLETMHYLGYKIDVQVTIQKKHNAEPFGNTL